MNDCIDDINATRDLSKMGESLELMNKKLLKVDLNPGYNSRSLDLIQRGDASFKNAPLLALASLSYRTKVYNSRDDDYFDILRVKITPNQLLERSREYDKDITAYDVERSLKCMLNNGILSKIDRIE